MKKMLCVLAVLMLLSALAIPAIAAGGSVSLSTSAGTLYRGDTFTVTASLTNSEAIALGTVTLNYNTDVFEMTGGSCHVSGVAMGQVLPGQKVGTFLFSGDPQVVSGKIFTFQMKVKDTATVGNYTISSSAAIGVDNGEPISSGSVSVTVSCHHSYGQWVEGDNGCQQICGICGDVQTAEHD